MGTYLPILCILLFSISILIISSQPVHAQQLVTATSVGLDNSSILELENNRGNDFEIDKVRIWLGEDNSFKSFKTENGWTGKFEVGGQVLVFSSQELIKPGESVKFGLKTSMINPAINWKALDSSGQVIQSAKTITSTPNTNVIPAINQPETSKPAIIAINKDSNFRLIPDKPSLGSDFRIIGENFVPNQNVDFYIDNKLIKSIQIDNDCRFISTAIIPEKLSSDRTEFSLVDSGGAEKEISIRISTAEKRDVSETIKISMAHTPNTVKKGETITFSGNATPDKTLTMVTKTNNGDILNIETFSSGFDGKWTFDNLFSPELDLGKIMIEITDGKSTIARSIQVISPQLINVSTLKTTYDPGDEIRFFTEALPNKEISVILEDPLGVEVFSKIISPDETGKVDFDIQTDGSYTEGTYLLRAFQGAESAVYVVGIGVEPQYVLSVKTSELNYITGTPIDLSIQGQPGIGVTIVVLDSLTKEKISESVQLDDNGYGTFVVEDNVLGNGVFTAEVRHGTTRGLVTFTVGLSTGSGAIEFQTIENEYSMGDQVLVIGKTGESVLLKVTISNPQGNIIRIIDTYSDNTGTFTIDNFSVPSEATVGEWTINVRSGENFKEHKFMVLESTSTVKIFLDKTDKIYKMGDLMTINGRDVSLADPISISIMDTQKNEIATMVPVVTGEGQFYQLWQIPSNLVSGNYEIMVQNGENSNSLTFTLK